MPLITFEGMDGCGKTTLASSMARWLEHWCGKQVLLTKEPGSPHNPITTSLRELILNPPSKLSDMTEMMLYVADRAQHVNEVVKPALKAGKWVLADRDCFSTYVYQCYVKKVMHWKSAVDLNKMIGAPDPSIRFVLVADVETAMKRVRARNEKLNRFDAADVDFYTKVKEGYIYMAAQIDGFLINADLNETQVMQQAVNALVDVFPSLRT